MKRLVLVRHGESHWNAEQRIQGQSGSGLSELGAAQAAAAAEWIAGAHPGARVWCSDLQRCRETVAPLDARIDTEVTYDQGLRERSFGDWEGLAHHEVAERYENVFTRWRAGEDVVGEAGGEATAVFGDRVLTTFARILDATEDGATAVCVTHGGVVWHGTRASLELGLEVLGPVHNTGITTLLCQPVDPSDDRGDGRGDGEATAETGAVADRLGVRCRLGSWNQIGHLPPDLQDGMPTTLAARRTRTDNAPTMGR